MREILFRGKRIDNGEWVEGKNILILCTGRTFIIQAGTNIQCLIFPAIGEENPNFLQAFYFEVDPETVGQYVFSDKNGKEIFEGDIVRHYYSRNRSMFTIGKVLFDDKNCKFTNKEIDSTYEWDMQQGCVYEVIGNIYDNPELLEVEE